MNGIRTLIVTAALGACCLPLAADDAPVYTAELVRAVAGQADPGDEIRLYNLDPSLDPETFPRHPDQVSTNPPWEDDLDVFHCTSWTWPAAFTGPTVYTCYDLTVLSHPACHTCWVEGFSCSA